MELHDQARRHTGWARARRSAPQGRGGASAPLCRSRPGQHHAALQAQHAAVASRRGVLILRCRRPGKHHSALQAQHAAVASRRGVLVLRCRRPGQHHAALQAQHAADASRRGVFVLRCRRPGQHYAALQAQLAASASRCGVFVLRCRRPGQHHAALQAQLAGQGGRRSEGDCCCGIRVLWPCAFAALRHGGVVLDSATPRRRPSAPGLRCALGTAAAPSGPAGPVASSDQRRGPGLERAPLHKGAPRDVRAENDQEDAHH
ncbi:unnamed protein product [Prorocentrum cordatum]|uniref:Uncharacterized protein n=1 Tax=Prorocentrum cordatum TaxID=2364126 RepID=A0ABN9TI45_9DINO|nr:unnamed protein product [Polarella glacialis]